MSIDAITLTISKREAEALLASLSFMQTPAFKDGNLAGMMIDVFTWKKTICGLSSDEIERLCRRLKNGCAAPGHESRVNLNER